jgi:hypothetical protein
MLEDMTVKDLAKILNLCKQDELDPITHNGDEIRIVILQRGWVIIGKYYQIGSHCWIDTGYVIRIWGTTKGLGELATEGKKENTTLDAIPKTEFHELTIVASIICDKSKWQDICK